MLKLTFLLSKPWRKVPAAWRRMLWSWNIEWLFGNNSCIIGCTWLPNLPLQVLSCSNIAVKGNNNCTNMDTRVLLPKPSWNLPRVEVHWFFQAFRIGCSPNEPSDHATRFQLYVVQGLWLWHHRLHMWELLLVIRGLQQSLLLMLDCKAHVGQGSSGYKRIQFCCHMCCSSSAIFRNNALHCMTVCCFCRCWFSSIDPLRRCCPPVICVCQHNLRNWCSRCA
jgi:hypothetical protein